MNKTAIKNFAVWARNKLIADITYKAGLLGISETEIKSPLPQSTRDVQFFDIGAREPFEISGAEIAQRRSLTALIEERARRSDYKSAYQSVVEEVAYTWFNRLISVRFMELNDYLPSRVRVLSGEGGKPEPDLVTRPFDADLQFTPQEREAVSQLKLDNGWDKLFRLLFIKQCNALNAVLPELFERTSDYSELLLNVSFTDSDGVLWHLVHDIEEADFKDAVQIIGWLYQYYNTEPKQAVFDELKKNVKISKEKIPAATQLFTPDWIVRYMVENSLGRLWLESHPNDALKANWKYYLDEAEQAPEVAARLNMLRQASPVKSPEDLTLIDPCMGSGHILVYAFDVLMQIYESAGYAPRDAAKLILEKNLYGLDIDRRAYQLAYFSLMMKARQYNRRILSESAAPQVYHPAGYAHGEEYGSLVKIDALPPRPAMPETQTLFDEDFGQRLRTWNFQRLLSRKYDVVVTNPPYMGSGGMSEKLSEYVKRNYPDSKSDLFAVFMEKCGELLKPTGYQAMITQHAWMFLSSYEKLRGKLLHRDIINMAHLGARAFAEIGGEVVQTTAFVLSKVKIIGYKGSYVRLVDYDSQDAKEEAFLSGSNRYTAAAENFAKIPGSPVAYWVSEKMLRAFEVGTALGDIAEPRQGLATGDNNVFLRLWFEISIDKCGFGFENTESFHKSRRKYAPYNKGGNYRRWYGNNEYMITFDENSYHQLARSGNKLPSRNLYFRESVTWSLITSGATAFRYKPQGHIFDVAGMSLFTDDDKKLRVILAFANTKIAFDILGALSPTINCQVGDVARIPFVEIPDDSMKKAVIDLVDVNIYISRTDWDAFETSWDFIKHPLI